MKDMINDAMAARIAIAEMFLGKYREFLDDISLVRSGKMDALDFDQMYGYHFGEQFFVDHAKDTQKNMLWFRSNIFAGYWLPHWIKIGYPNEVIWQLHRDKFLSRDEYSNWRARHTGYTDFFYLSAETAKQIYKDAKANKD